MVREVFPAQFNVQAQRIDPEWSAGLIEGRIIDMLKIYSCKEAGHYACAVVTLPNALRPVLKAPVADQEIMSAQR